MTNTTNMTDMIPIIDHASQQGFQWLFCAVLVLGLLFGWLVIKWLVGRTEAQNKSLEDIAKTQNETNLKLAVVIAQNSEALTDCTTEIKLCRETRNRNAVH